MINRTALLLALAIITAPAFFPHPATAADITPGKNSAFASKVDQTPLPQYSNTPLVSATISQGRSKRVLSIHATLNIRGPGTFVPGIAPTVNGTGAEMVRVSSDCSQQADCSLSGNWYFDVDAAEAANPGQFIGQPLIVNLLGGEISSTSPVVPWDISLSVLMVKK